MRRNEKQFGARFSVRGGNKFKADMKGIGKSGQDSMRKIKNSARAATPELLVLNKAAGGLNSIMRTGAGLAAAYVSINSLFSSVSGFASFEQNLVGVGKTTNIVGAELKALGDDVDALSRRIPVAAENLLGFAEAAGQAGVDGRKNILLVTETAAKLESATSLVGNEGVTSLVKILNITGEVTDNFDNLASAFVGLGNALVVNESQIVSNAVRVAVAGAQFGITSEQATGLGAAFISMGIEAELGGSTVARSFQEIKIAIREGGETLQILSELTGIAAQDLKREFGENAVGVFEKFLIGLNRAGDESDIILKKFDLNGVRLAQTLGNLKQNVDQVSTALALSSKEFSANTALNKEAAAAFDTLGSEGKILSNTMSSLSRGFADALSDELKTSTKEVRALTEAAIPASRGLGEDFAPAVVFASKALVTLVENGGTVVKVLGSLVTARVVGGYMSEMGGKALVAVAGFSRVARIAPILTARLIATEAAAFALKGTLAFIGGPVGLAILAAGGLSLLATRQTEAEKATEDHHKFLKLLNDQLDREGKTLEQLNKEKEKTIALRRQDAEATLLELKAKLELANNPVAAGGFGGGSGPGDGSGFGGKNPILRLEEEIKKQEDVITGYDKLEARRRFNALDNAAPFSIFDALASNPDLLSGSGKPSANDNLSPVTVQSFPNMAAGDAAALEALKQATEIQNIKPIAQTVEQYEKAREAIASTLAKMEIDSLRATGNVTEAIRQEADAQIAIWRQRAKDGVATDKEMFQAKKLINEQAARDIEQARDDMDAGLQAGKSAAATFTESLIAAGATSGSILQQLGRSFRTTMLKMVSDALLLKPIQSIFGSIFSSIASFLPGSLGAGGNSSSGGGGVFSNLSNPPIPTAMGNAFSNGNIIPFAGGGVFTTPHLFPLSGNQTGLFAEAGPEAIMPLSRGRDGKLGVKASGGGTVVNINVLNAPAGTQTRRKARADGGVDIDVIIPRAVASDILNGGDVADAIGEKFGLVAGGV